MKAHQLSLQEIFDRFRTSPNGLDHAEAKNRLTEHGPNELQERKKRGPLSMFLEQFRDFMIVVLLLSALVSGFLGEATDTIAIIVIVVLNAILGFVQEYRAEKAMEALKKMASAHAIVLRNGEHVTLEASQLVPGDVVLLEAGNIVPADMRIIESNRLKVEEAALTGESVPVEKHSQIIEQETLPLGDRKNMLYRGTFVTYGRATAVVTHTGMTTELGRIASMLQEGEAGKTPLQKRLASFGRRLAFAILFICGIVFVAGLLRGEEPLLMLLTAISLAVAAIPEALPAVVTISLAFGARKMVKQNALIRKLPAVETLGSVTYICTDKTGTITLNRMTVEEVWVDDRLFKKDNFASLREGTSTERTNDGGSQLSIHSPKTLHASRIFDNPGSLFFASLALNNDTKVDPEGALLGDPTETALCRMAMEHGYHRTDLEQILPRIEELPFDSERKLMTTLHDTRVTGSGPHSDELQDIEINYITFSKGAVEVLLERSTLMQTKNGTVPIQTDLLQNVSDRMAADGLRVMATAMRLWKEKPDLSSAENSLILLGLTGMMDPPREEARMSVELCKSAGIIPVMITGDHPLTARTIAKRAGILDENQSEAGGKVNGAILTGVELESLSLEEFEKRVEQIRVYARVAPEQKLKIVQALQGKGHFVAMTGDGVNDAPALKSADIGVAMGVTGTDVAKEASSMILLDDNFATIVNAVKEGRRIFDNIRKFIKYAMTGNSGEIWTILLAPFLGLPIPLLPIHILWINLVTDGLPGLALSTEPPERGIMERSPRPPEESIFSHGLGYHIVWVGLLIGGASLFTQGWAIHTGHSHWQTMVFTVLCLSQIGHVLAIRSDRDSLFQQGLLSNKPLLGAALLTLILQLTTIYVPFLNPVFKTQPLTIWELVAALALSSVVFFAVETEKWIRRIRIRKAS